MDPLSIISSGTSLIGNLFGGISTNKANLKAVRETNKANMELAQYQNDRNLELWNLENEYNTPAAQMARYEAAGLNPNLIYGNGTSSAGNASSIAPTERATMQAPKFDYGYIPTSAQLFMQGLNTAAGIRKTNSETAINYQQLENLQKDNDMKSLLIIHQQLQNAKTKEEKDLWNDMLLSQISKNDSAAMFHRANAELTDSNRFTQDALRPYVVAEAEQKAKIALEDVIQKKFQNSLNEIQRRMLTVRVANVVADTKLKEANTSYTQVQTEIKQILKDYGLNLDNDGIDRLLYQLNIADKPGMAGERVFYNTASTLGGAATGVLGAFIKKKF